jgi:trehalose 6-phosphate synthase/phosphatase
MDKFLINRFIKEYRSATSRVILLDYDGTLVDYTAVPDSSGLSDSLSVILKKLAETPQTAVFIITGRGYKDLDKIFYDLPVDIIAEHGAMIREGGIWKNQINGNSEWKGTIYPILDEIASSCPGSFIEEKSYSLAWHYRNAESHYGSEQSRKLISRLKKIIHLYNLKLLDGNKVVEIMPTYVGKGNAVKKLFEQNSFDFILSIGDDATDEEMFEYLLHVRNAFTIKVGNEDTFARYKLRGINDVKSLIKKLTK